MLQEPSGYGVPGLMIRHRLLLLGLQDLSLFLQAFRQEETLYEITLQPTPRSNIRTLALTSDDPLDGLLEVLLADSV